MHTLSDWFTRNPVAANLLMLFIIIAGVFTLSEIRIEGFPAIPSNTVSITTLYPGATTEQLDNSVSRPIERALEGMPGIKKISSMSSESQSIVYVQKVSKFDMDRFQNEIKSRIDSISTFPQMAERPIVAREEFNVEALVVQVYGNTDDLSLQKTARLVKNELLADPEITKIQLFGYRPYEISIDLDEDKLDAYGLSLSDVAQAIKASSLYYRTGNLKSSTGRIEIKADHQAFDYSDFVSIPILTKSNGSRILLGDIAQVRDGFVEEDEFARYQGMPSVGMQVYTSNKGHLIRLSEAAHKIVDKLRPELPQDIHVDIWGEYSLYMKDRLALLQENAWQGLSIVFILLALFLNVKLAFWVAMGIPISVAGTLCAMGERGLDYSLNDITTFGLIVVLGILVDDAVVVGESVFEQRRETEDPIEGTIKGVHKVSTATIFGCFTTVAAFYPILLIDNDIGRIFASFSVVVIVALLVSLIESKLILPAHLAGINLNKPPSKHFIARFWGVLQDKCSQGLSFFNNRIYKSVLRASLRHRYAVLVTFLCIALTGIGAIFKGHIRTVFFPSVPGQIITVNMQMKKGSPLYLTEGNLNRIEQCANDVNRELEKELHSDLPPIVTVMSALISPYEAVVYAELQPEKQREVETMETLKRWREKVGQLEGIDQLSFSGTYETGGGFIVELQARDDKLLQSAMNDVKTEFSKLDGVHDVRDDLMSGEPQIRLKLKPEAQHLGITTAELAQQIGDAFGGLEVQRFQRNEDEVKVMVRYSQKQRRYMDDLINSRILTNQNQWIPLPLIAEIQTTYAPGVISRRNGNKAALLRATLDKGVLSASEAFTLLKKDIFPKIQKNYPGIKMVGAGELEEMGEMKGGMKKAFVMIVLLIYVLIAIPLKSYWKPVVIMSVIPFGFVGAVIGHGITGHSLSVLSFFGMLAVMGIVVNDSLVMLTRYNDLREQGMDMREALITAGTSRFRAIFLTTVTTVCGLMPLILETSEQAQYLIPAAVSLAFGELFATPVTLILIPLLLQISDDFLSIIDKAKGYVGIV